MKTLTADREPLKLLVVRDIVLDGRAHAARLQAVDVRRRNRAVQDGVLRKGLEAASAKGRTLRVNGWGEEDVASYTYRISLEGLMR